MNKWIFLLGLWVLGQPCQAAGVVEFPKGPATWTIKFKKSDMEREGQPPALRPEGGVQSVVPQEVKVTQDGEMRVSEVRWSNGSTRATWAIPKMGLYMTEDPNGKTIIISKSGLFEVPFSPKNFRWINAKNRKKSEPVEYDGVMCYHHQGKMKSVNYFTDEEEEPTQMEAWIDAETKLPVAMDDGTMLGEFTFKPFEGNLEMPKKFAKKLKYFKVMMGME